MKPTTRRMIQILLVGFGLSLGVGIIALQTWAMSDVCAVADETGRLASLLGTVGGVLEGVGIIGMTVGTALGFPPGVSSPLVPGGIPGRNRAIRQIAGKEPYRVDEIAQLRRLAEYTVSHNRPVPAHGVAAFGLILAGVGILLGVPNFLSLDSGVATACLVTLGMGLLLVVAQQYLVRRLTRSGVAKAHLFLQRTQSVSPHVSGSH